ncbi:MAG TPA: tetratricopeptide repeat protein, partial [Polyangia bacterium]
YYRGLGDIALAEGRLDEARQLFSESLKQARDTYHFWSASLALSGLGRAALASQQTPAARDYFLQALQQAGDIANQGLELVALAGLAAVDDRQGQDAQAAALALFVINHAAAWRETREWAARTLEEAARSLEPNALEIARQQAGSIGMLEWMARYLSNQA